LHDRFATLTSQRHVGDFDANLENMIVGHGRPQCIAKPVGACAAGATPALALTDNSFIYCI